MRELKNEGGLINATIEVKKIDGYLNKDNKWVQVIYIKKMKFKLRQTW